MVTVVMPRTCRNDRVAAWLVNLNLFGAWSIRGGVGMAGRIVVGVDGSTQSRRALAWAVSARNRKCPVAIVPDLGQADGPTTAREREPGPVKAGDGGD